MSSGHESYADGSKKSTNDKKSSKGSLAVLDTEKKKHSRRSKSNSDDYSFQSESAGSKSSRGSHRRSGRRKPSDSSSVDSPQKGDRITGEATNNKEYKSSGSSDSPRRRQSRRRSLDSTSSSYDSASVESTPSSRGSPKKATFGDIITEDSKQNKSHRREGIKRDEDRSHGRVREKNHTDDRPSISFDDRSAPFTTNPLSPLQMKNSSAFGDVFAGFPLNNDSVHLDNAFAAFEFNNSSQLNSVDAGLQPVSKPTGSLLNDFTSGFDSTFMTEPNVQSVTTSFDSGFNTDFSAFQAFDQHPSFPMQSTLTGGKETNWDLTPLTDIPKMKRAQFTVAQHTLFARNFLCAPVSNPLNGNIILCFERRGEVCIEEIDHYRNNMQVECIPILSDELRQKVAAKYKVSIHSVLRVLTMRSGLHCSSGRTRVRVAAIVELRMLESNQSIKLVLEWCWGSQRRDLQYALSPPSGSDFSYDADTLCIADNLIFIAGMSAKGSFVFICKPVVSEAWSANYLATSAKVVKMNVNDRVRREDHPYIVAAFSDNSVSVWTYSSALTTSAFKDKNIKRCLFPLCRLDQTQSKETGQSAKSEEDEKSETKEFTFEECTEIVWLPPGSRFSSMMLVALAFQNGISVFHVGLPVVIDSASKRILPLPEPTSTTSLSSTPRISPIMVKRWENTYRHSSLTWIDIGSQTGPAFTVLLSGSKSGESHVLVASVEFPSYRKGPMMKSSLIPCHLLGKLSIPEKLNVETPGLLRSRVANSSFFYTGKELAMVSLSSVRHSEPLETLRFPPVSCIPGLSSSGDPIIDDFKDANDAVFYVFSTVQCERRKSQSGPSVVMEWTLPVHRYWVCRCFPGDQQITQTEDRKEDHGFGGAAEVLGGAESELVCELYHDSLVDLYPSRLVRCRTSEVFAVLFRTALGSLVKADGLQSVKIAFVNPNEKSSVLDVLKGRDIAFLPSKESNICQGLLLSPNGSALTFFEWNTVERCQLTTRFRPIVGVDCDKNYIDCRRILTFPCGSKIILTAVGKRILDNRVCFVTGNLCEAASINSDSWSQLLPNIVSGQSYWFEPGEDLLSVIGLEGDSNGSRNFAVATSIRVMILSFDLRVLAEKQVKVSSGNISPLGSFAVCFVAFDKVQYLCCLEGLFRTGLIASLVESNVGLSQTSLFAVRPDRLILCSYQSSVRLIECGENSNKFLLPIPSVKPALLLEPMVANALSIGKMNNQATAVLRTVIERFGRKIALITHGENEGIGQKGAGLTSKLFRMLEDYNCRHAASWLLTGTVQFERSANTIVLPPWQPISAKTHGTLNVDGVLHVLCSGDSYLSEYIKSPDQSMPATLPRLSDSTSYLSSDYAEYALASGKAIDSFKMLDLAGTESADSSILQLALMVGRAKTKNSTGILASLSGFDKISSQSSTPAKAAASLAALAYLENRKVEASVEEAEIIQSIKPLAPSFQLAPDNRRIRQRLIGEKVLDEACGMEAVATDRLWTLACNESKHLWNEGPRKDRSKLLMLDRVEDWLERKRPVILGREGASTIQDRGEKTLADILNQDDDSFGEKTDTDSIKDIWVEGVGEGRSDEANLSGYFRFSEGEDEDSSWRSVGFADLSPYKNKVVIVGDPDIVSVQTSTSNVDEGEPGKVKGLFDIVFDKSGVGFASGVAVSAPRGGSLDLGVLHTSERDSRKKCSIEFWYYLPNSECVSDEIILIRRTVGESANIFTKVGVASDADCVLWELAVCKTGQLVFRSCGGSALLSTQNYKPMETLEEAKESDRPDLASFDRWNHVCLVLSSKGLEWTECALTIYMKGTEVASSVVSFLPRGFDKTILESDSKLSELLLKSHILLGLNHPPGFRLTELRFWACTRSSDDVLSFLYEYLTAAEQKKKFKVKITSKNKKGAVLGKLEFAPPKSMVGGPSQGAGMQHRGMVPLKSGGLMAFKGKASVLGSKEMESEFDCFPQTEASGLSVSPEAEQTSSPKTSTHKTKQLGMEHAPDSSKEPDASIEESPDKSMRQSESAGTEVGPTDSMDDIQEDDEIEDETDGPITLWDTAVPLSQQIRSSAAAALIRGPPATRHYGGNRGGLPDFSGVERFGVGGIAICGSEKTIVFRDNEDPPALTYPIGASGAVVSDQMDDEGSEFLCCFLAKEKRMVVFELRSRTVVVELQMTTKLNFWRYLPPEAAENTLCFMLVTPVGGFHWMPLEESPRPHQVWKRGAELQGKKIVSYEEGGSNALDDEEIRSKVGLVMATKASGGPLEAWIVPIAGNSRARLVSDDLMGACFCQPVFLDDDPFLPMIVTVHGIEDGIAVKLLSIIEPENGSVKVGGIIADQEIDNSEYTAELDPPLLAMGTHPEVLCVSLSNIIVVLIRRKGVICAFELEEDQLNLIAQECVDHYVIDAVMRYSAEVGGAEIVMLLSDNENPKDGRIVSFCFRSAA